MIDFLHSAEIPPAGAPAGFDSAAMVNSAFDLARRCRSAQNDTEGSHAVGYNLKVVKVTLVRYLYTVAL